jgi:hypothetical protein
MRQASSPVRSARADDRAEAARRAILVLGAHRSGTSAVARVINLLGAALPGPLLEPTEANPTGYWEPHEIVALHDEMLASAGQTWHDVSAMPSTWFRSDAAHAFRRRIVDNLRGHLDAAPLFVVKDPRICRFVPLWLEALAELGAEPLFVLPIRNPIEVAGSLRVRDGLSCAKSYLIWLRHVLDAERDTRGYRRSIVEYERLLVDWRSVAEQVGRDLEIAWPRQSHRSVAEIEAFLSDELRHHRIPRDEVQARSDIIAWVKAVYAATETVAVDQSAAQATFDAIRADLDAAEAAFGPLLAEAELQAEASLEQARSEATVLVGEVAARDAELARLVRVEIAARDAEVGRLNEVIIARDAELARLAAEQTSLVSAMASLNGELAAATAAAAHAQAALAARADEVGRLVGDVDARDREIRRLIDEAAGASDSLAAASDQVAALRASTSWRVTAPLRAVGALTRRLRHLVPPRA